MAALKLHVRARPYLNCHDSAQAACARIPVLKLFGHLPDFLGGLNGTGTALVPHPPHFRSRAAYCRTSTWRAVCACYTTATSCPMLRACSSAVRKQGRSKRNSPSSCQSYSRRRQASAAPLLLLRGPLSGASRALEQRTGAAANHVLYFLIAPPYFVPRVAQQSRQADAPLVFGSAAMEKIRAKNNFAFCVLRSAFCVLFFVLVPTGVAQGSNVMCIVGKEESSPPPQAVITRAARHCRAPGELRHRLRVVVGVMCAGFFWARLARVARAPTQLLVLVSGERYAGKRHVALALARQQTLQSKDFFPVQFPPVLAQACPCWSHCATTCVCTLCVCHCATSVCALCVCRAYTVRLPIYKYLRLAAGQGLAHGAAAQAGRAGRLRGALGWHSRAL